MRRTAASAFSDILLLLPWRLGVLEFRMSPRTVSVVADVVDPNPNLILPVGTQVVALADVRGTDGRPVHPRGAVGVVIQSPADYWHSYRVRFPDAFEASFRRQDLAVLSHYKQGLMGT